MKAVIFPVHEEKSWLVKYRHKGELQGMYVRAVDEASAKWQVEQQVKGCQVISTRFGLPSEREWE